MAEFTGFWLNVDLAARTCTVHGEACPLAAAAEAEYRGTEHCREHGGWLWFSTGAEIDAFHRAELAPLGATDPRDCDRCGGAG